MEEHTHKSADSMARLALCAVVAAAVVYAGEKLCEGKGWSLWDRYGPWILENRLQAIAILAAVLYGASLALWPEGPSPTREEVEGFEPCP